MKAKDLTGLKFNRLTVLEFSGRRRTAGGESKRTWKCECECGNKIVLDGGSLVTGNTTSCGCYDKERRVKHGMHDTRFYDIWSDMKSRCDKPSIPCYERYGGRGISYDPRWSDFLEFKNEMFEGYEDNLTLDRIDPNGDYIKENCRWATKDEQGRNRTMLSTNKTGVTGVRVWIDKKTDTKYFVAEATGSHKRKGKYFSVTKYGEDQAFKLACEFRQKFIEDFNSEGILFSEYHGKEKK